MKKAIQRSIDDFVFNQLHVADDVQFYVTNSWAVKHSPGDWAQFHVHTNCLLSGVYYFDVKENQGELCFTKDLGNANTIFPLNVNLEFKENNLFNSKRWYMKPNLAAIYKAMQNYWNMPGKQASRSIILFLPAGWEIIRKMAM